MVKENVVINLPVSHAMNAPLKKTLGITHHDDVVLYIYTDEHILFITQNVVSLVKIDHTPSSFHDSVLYRDEQSSVGEFYSLHIKPSEEKFRALRFFSNEYSREEKYHLYNHILIHYHNA